MRYRKQTDGGDYTFGASQLDFYRDVPQAVGQAVKTRLLLWVGEWFLNIEEGTPYPTNILGKHSETEANVTIQDRVEGTQGLVAITSYKSALDPDTRNLTVTMSIDTVYGPTTVQVENYVNY